MPTDEIERVVLNALKERLADTRWLADQIRARERDATKVADILRAIDRCQANTDGPDDDALAKIFPSIIDRIDAKTDQLCISVNLAGMLEPDAADNPKLAAFEIPFQRRQNGRPKGAKNKRPGLHEERMKDIIIDEAYRDTQVREGDRTVSIPMAVNAAKGQHKAQQLFSELLAATETSRRILNDRWLETAIEYKVGWDKELRRRDALGITDLAEPMPHPDQVKIDFIEGSAHVAGPMTKEERVEYDWLIGRRADFEEELSQLAEEREEAVGQKEIQSIDHEIARTRRVREILAQLAGE